MLRAPLNPQPPATHVDGIARVIVDVIAPVMVAALLNGNETVGVIDTP
jgi:hypothetical protein